MAKLNIPFNNKNYSIDESSLSAASADLKKHLSTVMNGTGATIKFGGVAYNIDSTKLSNATNAFVTHLGTVSGSGYKVVVNGTEHNVASAKMTTAVSDLEIVLGNIHSDDEGSQEPEKNEYGFYYNVPYVAEINEDGYVYNMAYVFYEDNKVLDFTDSFFDGRAEEMLTQSDVFGFEYDNEARTGTLEWGFTFTFSEDGSSFVFGTNGEFPQMDGLVFAATADREHGVYYNTEYVSESGDIIIFPDKSTVIISNSTQVLDTSSPYETFVTTKEHYTNHNGNGYTYQYLVSIDGDVVYVCYYTHDHTEDWVLRFERRDNTSSPDEGGSDDVDYPAAGLYETGSNYTVMKKSWDELLADGTVHVDNGVVYTNMDMSNMKNNSSSVLVGDLALPNDGSVAKLGDFDLNTMSGNIAFMMCDKLTGIRIPDCVTTIGFAAFQLCSSLNNIIIHDFVTIIMDYSFADCTAMTNLVIGNSVASIGSRAFSNCTALTSINIPNSVTSIGEGAFSGCDALTSINIPNSVTSIGSWAFNNCPALTSISIPNSVTSVGQYAFNNVSPTNVIINMPVIEGSLFDCANLTTLKIGDSITYIGEGAFNYSKITSLNIPDSVTYIGNNAFSWCRNLESLTIGSGITSMGYRAFSHCDNLKSVVISDGTTVIGDMMFEECTSLESVEIPSSVTTIGYEAFKNCTNLANIEIPNTVTSIGHSAFQSCSNIKSINIPNGITTIDNSTFSGTSIESIIIPTSVTHIGSWALSSESLTSISYCGTVEQWNAIEKYNEKYNEWNRNVPATHVQCTDGQVPL